MDEDDRSQKLLTGLAPITSSNACVLVLGSMPGVRSLQLQQYYAHPQNRFWPIMGQLFDAGPQLPYPERVQRLHSHRIAVWDVLKHCEREGSLDTSIRTGSEVANDFAVFFANHRQLQAVFFNGKKAESSFSRYVIAAGVEAPPLRIALPSTSPANASLTYERRLEQWRRIVTILKA